MEGGDERTSRDKPGQQGQHVQNVEKYRVGEKAESMGLCFIYLLSFLIMVESNPGRERWHDARKVSMDCLSER